MRSKSNRNDQSPSAFRLFEKLEERTLFDAVPILPVPVEELPDSLVEEQQHTVPATNESPSPDAENSSAHDGVVRHELFVVDARLAEESGLVEHLLAHRDPALHRAVVTVQDDQNGLERLTQELADRSQVDLVSIFATVQDGQHFLGRTALTGDQLGSHAASIANWFTSMSPDATIQLGSVAGTVPDIAAELEALTGFAVEPESPTIEQFRAGDTPSQPPGTAATTVATEIAFIDRSVDDYQLLVEDILRNAPHVELHYLNSDQDGLTQMIAALSSHDSLNALHLVSHGSQAELLLGSTRLDFQMLSADEILALHRIGQFLANDADILVYGCDFGSGSVGAAAVQTLSRLTDADVAASDDPTGSAGLGGDWDFETSFGSVNTALIFSELVQTRYSSILEGTADVSPTATDFVALAIKERGANSTITDFANYDGPVDQRLHIRIADPENELVYLGFGALIDGAGGTNGGQELTRDYYFRIKDPDGNIVKSAVHVDPTGSAGSVDPNLNNWTEAAAGPDVLNVNGYDTSNPAWIFDPSGLAAGDYYIEFDLDNDANNVGGTSIYIKWFDITVVDTSGTNSTAVDGRVWSKAWQFRTKEVGLNSFEESFNGAVYVYDSDQMVTRVDFQDSDFRGLTFTLAFSETGTGTSGDIEVDRRSLNSVAAITPQYHTFLNLPDEDEFARGTEGDFTQYPFTVDTTGTPNINLSVSQDGQVELILDFDDDGSFTVGRDRRLYADVTTGDNQVAWDGLDGSGAAITVSGYPIPVIAWYTQGVTHLTVYDVEGMDTGFEVTTVYPTGDATPQLQFWDDVNIPDDPNGAAADTRTNLDGAISRQTWTSTNYGDLNTLNTWWYAIRKLASTVVEIQRPPVATDNSGAVTEDSVLAASGDVLLDDDGAGIDSDPNNDPLIVSAVNGQPANVNTPVSGTYGTLTLSTDGTYTYTLNNLHADVQALDDGEQLNDTFTYQITDGHNGFDTATLTILIHGTNDAPVIAGTIPNQTDADSEVVPTLDVSGYFSDPDTTDSLTFTASGLPGGLSINSAGQISGTLDSDASQGGPLSDGVYTVTVTATDDSNASVSTTFSWTVTNPVPTATDNSGSVTEDVALSDAGNLLTDDDGPGIDSDPDGDPLVVSAVEGDVANVGVTVTGAYGEITINANGTYTYTLDNPLPAVQGLDENETLTETFAYTISDGQGGTDSATLTITIHGRNDAPVVGGTIPNQTDADSETVPTLDVSGYFSDPDTTDSLTFTASGLPGGLSISSAGQISGTLDSDASQGGPLSDGVYTVTVTATDDSNATISTTFTWTVTNPAPTATDNTASVTEDLDINDSGNVLTDDDGPGIDSDADGDPLVVSAVDGDVANVGVTVTGTYGEITINANGSYTYTLNNSLPAVQGLDENETLTETFGYTISDGQGGTDSATLTITIHGRNDAPVVGGTISNQTDADSETVPTLDVSGYFSDPDTTDSLTFTASGLPGGLSINSAGQISGTLDSDASQGGPLSDGVYTVTVTATDNSSATVSMTFTWTVTNPTPTATDNTASVTEDLDINDSGNLFTDDDGPGIDSDPDGDPLVVSAVDGDVGNVGVTVTGTYGEITINANGSYTYTLDNALPAVQGLDENETLTETFGYTISDGQGGTASATLTVTIHGRNDAPVVGGTIPNQTDTDSDVVPTLDVSGYFSDPDTTDSLTFTASGLPGGLSINSVGEISGTLDNDASQGGPLSDGVYTVTVTATDDSNASVSSTFSWTVTNPAPTATDNTASVTEDLDINDSGNLLTDDDGPGIDGDPDGDPLVVSAVDGDVANVGVTVTGTYGEITINANGIYTYTLDNALPAIQGLDEGETLTETFGYTISDGQGGTDSATLTITIHGRNDAPVVGGTISNQTDADSETVPTLDVSGYFSDPDTTDSLIFTASGLPGGLSINSAGEISGTLDNDASQGGPLSDGVYTVTVTATDDSNATISTTFTWTVTNPAPTATDNTASVTEDLDINDSGNLLTDDDGPGIDNDPDGDPLVVSAVDGDVGNIGVTVTGTYGEITINANGSYTYTLDNALPTVQGLDEGETLTEAFGYTISDGQGGTDSATLTITIHGRNDAPVVGGTIPNQTDADSETVPTLDVSGYFSDPDTTDSLTFTASGLPGGLSINSAGQISETLDSDASQGGPLSDGVYTVTVTATDNSNATVSTTFTWTVTNPAPTATDNSATVSAGVTALASGNVLTDDDGVGADSDPDNDLLVVSAVNGDVANVGIPIAGSYGQITFSANGSYTYALNDAHPTVQALKDSETLTETFTYTASDGQGGTDSATLTVTISGNNDAPIVVSPIPDRVNIDTEAVPSTNISGHFSDPDSADSLIFSASGLPWGLTITPDGTISGTLQADASQGGTLSDGVYTVTITATDASNATASTSFTWTVTNPVPTATDNTASVTEDLDITDHGNVLTDDDGDGVDSDIDSDPLQISAVNGDAANVGVATQGNYGTLTLASDGVYTYVLDNTHPLVQALDENETLLDTFTYTLSDGQGGTNSATLTVTIQGRNDIPFVFATIPNHDDVDSDTISTLDVSGFFSDRDTTDSLTFIASGLPGGLSIGLNGEIAGTLDSDASQGGPLSNGVYTVTVTAVDDSNATITTNFLWSITNPVPTATDNSAMVTEDVALNDTGNVLTDDDGAGTDSDPDHDLLVVSAVDGDATNVGLAVTGTYGELTINADGSYTFTLDNALPAVQALDESEALTETFAYTVSDGQGGTDSATLMITIEGSNDAPW